MTPERKVIQGVPTDIETGLATNTISSMMRRMGYEAGQRFGELLAEGVRQRTIEVEGHVVDKPRAIGEGAQQP